MLMVAETGSKSGFRLPRYVMRWVAAGLILTSTVVILISLLSGVTLSDVAKIGYLTFVLASIASSARLILQVLRFRVLARGLTNEASLDLRGLATVRVSSEFVSLLTPTASMGFFLNSAWLSTKGVKPGQAVWISYFELLVQVYVGVVLALFAAAYAFTSGAILLGSTIAAVAGAIFLGFTAIVIVVQIKRTLRIPQGIIRFVAFLFGEPLAKRLDMSVQENAETFCRACLGIFRSENLSLMLKALALTVIEYLLGGATLWLVLASESLKIDLISATIAVYGVFTIAQLPITLGGAGITELTMNSYLSAVYGFSSWAAVVVWRIAYFQVLIAVSGIAFLLFLRKVLRSSPETRTKLGKDIDRESIEGSR